MKESEPTDITDITEALGAFLVVLSSTVRDLNRMQPGDHASTYFLVRLREYTEHMASGKIEGLPSPEVSASLRKIVAMFLRGMESR